MESRGTGFSPVTQRLENPGEHTQLVNELSDEFKEEDMILEDAGGAPDVSEIERLSNSPPQEERRISPEQR